ncbi:MFS general substrate transporter [Pyrenochaeta sp. DS3sAY3a]|nr:MFS general substrate transporter [Pyrenochaeta sp. DS3sAY3a]
MSSSSEDVFHGGEQEAAEHSPLLEGCEQPSDNNATTDKCGTARPSHLLLVIIPALILSSFVPAFDLSFFMNNYTRIASDLHNLRDAVWTVLAGSISAAIIQPIYSHLSAVYGRSLAIVSAYIIFGLGTAFCALSPTLWVMAVSRIIVGIGSSAGALLATIILNDLVSLTDIAIWRALFTCFDTVATMGGGPLGNFIARSLHWRWMFFLETIAIAAAIVVLIWSLRSLRKAANNTPIETLLVAKPVDAAKLNLSGGLLLVVTVTAPLCALTIGGGALPWHHPLVIALFAVTPCLGAGLYYHEKYIAVNPTIPIDIVSRLPIIRVFITVFSVVFALNVILFNLPLYTQTRALDGTTFSDYALTCVFIGIPLGALFSGFVIQKTQQNRITMTANGLVSGILYALFASGVIPPDRPTSALPLALLGFSAGIWQSTLLVALLAVVEVHYQPHLIAVYGLVLVVGGDLAIALSSSISHSLFIKNLQQAPGRNVQTDEIIRRVFESLENVRGYDPAIRGVILNSFEHAIRSTFIFSCIAIVVVLFTVYFITESDRELSTLTKTGGEDLRSPSDGGYNDRES